MIDFQDLFKTDDLWSYLTKTDKPIVLYGMGDGADKILAVLEQKNIAVSGIFASDDFVRGQSFHSFQVQRYDYFRGNLKEFIILVCFATRLPEVMQTIKTLSLENELYAPDVPVFGEGLFDSEYLLKHRQELEFIYSHLCDIQSQKVFTNCLAYKITGKIEFLFECESDVGEAYESIVQPKEKDCYVDIGAYTGDTINEYLAFAGTNVDLIAFEPDVKNYARLCKNTADIPAKSVSLHNIAAWDKREELTFFSRSGRNSAKTTSSQSAKSIVVNADTVDSYIKSRVDYIKIDAEGSDLNVLCGLEQTIRQYKPTICAAVYHRNEDLFVLPNKILSICPEYRLYLRHFPYIPGWDTNIYAKFRK